MSAPIAIVTGASTGIGFQTARALVKKGYEVIIATYDSIRGQAAADAINHEASHQHSADVSVVGRASFMLLDTSSLQSVREFAASFTQIFNDLHVLVLNAGISGFGLQPGQKSNEGYNYTYATNYLGHFLLTQLLLPLIISTSKKPVVPVPCRIVSYASVTHRFVSAPANGDWTPLFTKPRGQAYALSKLSLLFLAYQLQRYLPSIGATNVIAIAVNPGGVNSDIWRALGERNLCMTRPLRRMFMLNTEQGAATGIAAATEVEVSGVRFKSGQFYYLSPYWVPSFLQNNGPAALVFDFLGPFAGAQVIQSAPGTYDSASAKSLWDCSMAAVNKTNSF